MRIEVNGVRLFVDVVGAQLSPQGGRMQERPTLVLLHGGPGADHSLYRPHMDALADVAQLVYYDHRGSGRSDDGPRELWTLAQWADDLVALCAVLGIERPFVYGASFGGMVAQAYATRHPGHARGLVLESTAARGGAFAGERVAKFGQLGGEQARALAQRRFVDGDTSAEVLAAWLEVCLPLYARQPLPAAMAARMISRPAVTAWFNRPGGEVHTFDFRAEHSRITCPVLVMGGSDDPMIPIENTREIAAHLPAAPLQLHVFEDARHMLGVDAPEQHLALLRAFVQQHSH